MNQLDWIDKILEKEIIYYAEYCNFSIKNVNKNESYIFFKSIMQYFCKICNYVNFADIKQLNFRSLKFSM